MEEFSLNDSDPASVLEEARSAIVQLHKQQKQIGRELAKRRKAEREAIKAKGEGQVPKPKAATHAARTMGLTVAQAAALLRINPHTVWDYLRAGTLEDLHPLTVGLFMVQGYGWAEPTEPMLKLRQDWRDHELQKKLNKEAEREAYLADALGVGEDTDNRGESVGRTR